MNTHKEYNVTWTDTDGDTVTVTVLATSRNDAREAWRRVMRLAGDTLPPAVGRPTVAVAM